MAQLIEVPDSAGRCSASLRRRPLGNLCAGALLLAAIVAAGAAQQSSVLRTSGAVRNLSPSEAALGYPVQLERAQVLLLDSGSDTLFVRDQTGGLAVDLRGQTTPAVHSGDVVRLDGFTGPGDSIPVIVRPVIHVLGRAPLPPAPTISFDRLSSGAYESQWVAVEGIVHSAAPVDSEPGRSTEAVGLRLTLVSGKDRLQVVGLWLGSIEPSALVDAQVRLRGVVRNQWNRRKLLVGTVLTVPDLSCLQIVEAPPAMDPFTLPLVHVADMTTSSLRAPDHRVHVRGVVTSAWSDRNFSLLDSGHGTFVAAVASIHLRVGDVVDVAGFPSDGDYAPYLDGALVRRTGFGTAPAPARLTAAQAFSGDHDAEPVELEGDLMRIARGDDGIVTLFLSDAGTPFQAVFPAWNNHDPLPDLGPASRLRIRGVLVIHADSDHTPERLDILLRSPADVVVLRSPPLWTSRRIATAAVVLLAIVLVVTVWNLVLRERVRAQTRRIRIQLKEARLLRQQAEAAQEKLRYQASHDGLTGLWNRPALLEFLHQELERMQRTRACLGILLLDIDHFKAINDTHGHLLGDAALCEIGSRISRGIRPYDIAGRYGGEEFLILLPGCDREAIGHSAERIRLLVGATPFSAAAATFTLTVSIGATIATDSSASETLLLNEADVALYQAKSSGRNQTILYTAELAHPAG